MRKYRSHTAAALTTLSMIGGCCHHPPVTLVAIATPEGLTRARGQVGDVIQWTTQIPDGPGYCVKFRDGSPCQPPFDNDFHVATNAIVACTIVAPKNIQPGQAMSVTYQIVPDPIVGKPTACPIDIPVSNKPVQQVNNKGAHVFSIIPCRGCTASSPEAGPANQLTSMAKPAAGPSPRTAGANGYDTTPIEITCSTDGKTTIIPNPSSTCIVMDGSTPQLISWDGNIGNVEESWSASRFSPSSICQGNYSNTASSYCTFDSTVFPQPGQPATYTYRTTLAGCGSTTNTAKFTVTLANTQQDCPTTRNQIPKANPGGSR
jgi:hypothetical protein